MGGYTSRVATPPPQQSFSTNESTPARVHFSPELLKQLHQEQEAKLIHRSNVMPHIQVVQEEPEAVQMERHARIERERHELAIKEAERRDILAAEEAAARRAQEVLSRLEKKTKLGSDNGKSDAKSLNDACSEEAKRLTGMLESWKLDEVFEELQLYESCVKRESKARSQSLL